MGKSVENKIPRFNRGSQNLHDSQPSQRSAIWNFILECHRVVTNHLTWQIGDGIKANFWEDSWAGLPALREVGDFTGAKELLV